MNDLEDYVAGGDRGARRPEWRVQFPAVAAFESNGERAVKRAAASIAKRRVDKPHLLAATGAHKTFAWRGPPLPTKLASLGIEKAQPGVEPAAHRSDECVGAGRRHNQKDQPVRMATRRRVRGPVDIIATMLAGTATRRNRRIETSGVSRPLHDK